MENTQTTPGGVLRSETAPRPTGDVLDDVAASSCLVVEHNHFHGKRIINEGASDRWMAFNISYEFGLSSLFILKMG